MIAAGLVPTFTAAKTALRKWPAKAAELHRLTKRVAPEREPVIFGELRASLAGDDDETLSVELILRETRLDGSQDDAFDLYRLTPVGTDRELRARQAAHECFRHAKALTRLGRAILREENLT